MHKYALKTFAAAALALGAACATSTVEPPPNFSQAPTVTRIYAVDPAGRLKDILIFSSTGEAVSPTPPSYTRFRVEFDQPIDASNLQKTLQDDIFSNSSSVLGGGFTYSFCSPKSTTSPGVQFIDVDDTTHVPPAQSTCATAGTGTVGNPNCAVWTSVCYDATQSIGVSTGIVGGPHLTIVTGSGVPGGTGTGPASAPFTCQAFSAASSNSQAMRSKHTYGLKFDPATITNSANTSKQLVPPTTGGWSGNTFQFKTSGFEIMAVGTQSSITGFFDWIDKPYKGYQKDLAVTGSAGQIVCDPTSLVSKPGCRIFSDGATPFFIITSEPVAGDSDGIVSGVSIVRTGQTAPSGDPDSIAVAEGANSFNLGSSTYGGRAIGIWPGFTFEPGQSYTVTVDPAVLKSAPKNGETSTTLDTPPAASYTFIAGPGPNGIGQDVTVLAAYSAPVLGQAEVPVDLSTGITVVFQLPVDDTTVTGSTFTVTQQGGGAITGTAAVVPGSNHQLVAWAPDTAPTKFGATYNVSVKGVKVASVVSQKGQTFPDYNISFTTQQFTVSDIFASDSAEGGTRNMPLEALVDGSMTVGFTDAADETTVSNTSIALKQVAATSQPAYTVTKKSGDTYTVKLTDATQTIKFNEQYSLTAATSIKQNGTGQALHAENCTTTDCPDARGFYTKAFAASMSTPPRSGSSAGSFSISFNYPVDPSTVTPLLTTSFHLLPGTFDVDKGFAASSGTGVAMTCTLAGNNKSISCAPTGGASALSPNTFYRAIATLSGVKVAPTITSNGVTVNLDQVTGTINSSFASTFISGCSVP